MKSKRYLFIVSFIILAVLAVQFANAGFLDKFFGREPELGPVGVDVSLGNSPPFIAKYFLIPLPPLNQPFNPIAGSTTTAYIGFVAQDPNGANDLPTMSGSVAGIVAGGIGAPVNSPSPANSIIRVLNSCTSYDCTTGAPGPPGQFFACDTPQLANQKAYVCDATMTYSDPPSLSTTNANDLWRISIAINDLGAGTGTIAASPSVVSGMPGFANIPNDYLRYNALSAYNIPLGSTISFTALLLTTPNQPAASPIAIENYGNVPLPTTQITGSNLIGANNPTATLSTAAFSASGSTGGAPPSECNVPTTAVQLQAGIAKTIPGVSIPWTSAGAAVDRDTSYYCANQALNTPGILTGTDTQFAGTWTITAS